MSEAPEKINHPYVAQTSAASSARSGGEQSHAERVPFHGLLANRLLATLSGEDFARLLPHLEPVSIQAGKEIYKFEEDVTFAYFPEDMVVSRLHVLADGGITETALIGREGMIGLSAILNPLQLTACTQVLVGGSALRLPTKILRQEFARGGGLQQVLLTYAGARIAQISQRAICNGRHKLEERFCCWLLMVQDRAGANRLPLTHEQMARHLGVRRAGVTGVAHALRDKDIINYSRGHVTILDRQAMEATACECYSAPRLPLN
ncbi:MAG TPA: Crp/Fnr family transcriptional regulator [Pyrinomonadaceae bacterium]|nr:Crp/Fnr family transcriptional regulator [Pyrinomonadaceae bacterium]